MEKNAYEKAYEISMEKNAYERAYEISMEKNASEGGIWNFYEKNARYGGVDTAHSCFVCKFTSAYTLNFISCEILSKLQLN